MSHSVAFQTAHLSFIIQQSFIAVAKRLKICPKPNWYCYEVSDWLAWSYSGAPSIMKVVTKLCVYVHARCVYYGHMHVFVQIHVYSSFIATINLMIMIVLRIIAIEHACLKIGFNPKLLFLYLLFHRNDHRMKSF